MAAEANRGALARWSNYFADLLDEGSDAFGGGGWGGGSSGGFDGGGADVGGDDSIISFYRGTTYYDALRDQAEGFSAARLAQRQLGRQMDPGLYTSQNSFVADYFAYYNAGVYSGQGGAALLEITLPTETFERIASKYGVVERPVSGLPGAVPQPHTETLFPYAAMPELYESAKITVWKR